MQAGAPHFFARLHTVCSGRDGKIGHGGVAAFPVPVFSRCKVRRGVFLSGGRRKRNYAEFRSKLRISEDIPSNKRNSVVFHACLLFENETLKGLLLILATSCSFLLLLAL